MHASSLILAAGIAAPGSQPAVRTFDHVVVTAQGPQASAPAFGLDLRKGLLVTPDRTAGKPTKEGPRCAVRVTPADPDVDRGIHRPTEDVVDPAMAVRGRCVP